MNQHTISTVATTQKVHRRTVQLWLQKAQAERGDIGQKQGNTRVFTDDELAILLSYSGTNQGTNQGTKEGYETTNPEIVDAEIVDPEVEGEAPIVAQSFNLAEIRGVSQGPPVALAEVNQAVSNIRQLRQAIRAELQKQEQNLLAEQQAADELHAEAQALELEVAQYQTESKINKRLTDAAKKRQETSLGKLNDLGVADS